MPYVFAHFRQGSSATTRRFGGLGLGLAIALTAYAGEIDYQQAMAVGFQQHISKPVEPEVLIGAIARLLNQI